MLRSHFFRKTRFIIIVLILGLILLASKPVSSQSITGINAEISGLRSRISRLESEVRNLRSGNLSPAPGIPKTNPEAEANSDSFNNPPVVDDRAIGRSDPLFERLATLLIELKEDVNNLENRVDILEGNNRG
jgi:outer membrane murein-binding lipoprotein Lpp